MSCGRLAAVGAAIVLLVPGLCFFLVGITALSEPTGLGIVLALVGIAILGLAGWIFVKTREPEPWVTRLTEEPPKEQEPPKTE